MPGSSLVLTQTVYARFQNQQCAIRKEQLLPFVASLTFPKLDCILNTTYCYTNIPVILCYDDIIFEPNLYQLYNLTQFSIQQLLYKYTTCSIREAEKLCFKVMNKQPNADACIYDICGLVSGSQRRSAEPRPQICPAGI